ncbi:MAG: type I-E CRISPR-associated protein Cas6/Cse3/CasE [Chlorobi bacterium]|nr:type I-E CRISPR-associated protein Cas6/Cse3/CasE [Chlorobiota bacterium]
MLTYLDLLDTRKAPTNDLQDPYSLHQTLRRIFGGQHLTYRVDHVERAVLVRSESAGDYATLAEGYLHKKAEIEEPIVERGGVHKLRFCVNPTRCESRTGKRFGLKGSRSQEQWAGEQLRRAGFEVIRLERVQEEWLQGSNGARLLAVDFRGVVVITDEERAKEAVAKGIGRGKAWGCGMVVLT